MSKNVEGQAVVRVPAACSISSWRCDVPLAAAFVSALVAVSVASLVGCKDRSPSDSTPSAATPSAAVDAAQLAPERPWSEQVARVRAGSSDEIRLERTAVTSAELAELNDLAGLRTLVLDAGRVSDEDAAFIATLSNLEHLRLRESPLSDRGLAELAQGELDSLVILNLPQATPTAEGLEELAKLPRVRQLRISGRQIDDAAITALTKWPELTSLHLIAPGISEKSLETIAAMPKMISFYLDDCSLADSAWEKFFRARPGLHVHIDQAHHDRDPSGDH